MRERSEAEEKARIEGDALRELNTVAAEVSKTLKALQATAAAGVAAAGVPQHGHATPQAAGASEAAQKAAAAKVIFDKVSGFVVAERWEEAFSEVLTLADIKLVLWLCKSSNASKVLGGRPPLLSAPVVLSLVHQLAYDLGTETVIKIAWLRESVMALNPKDPVIASHVPGVLKGLLGTLGKMEGDQLPVSQDNDFRLLTHVVRSMCQ